MKTRGKIWVIFDAESNTQSKPMSVVQAQVTLLSLASKDCKKYFLWTPGWESWVSLKEFLESDQNYFVLTKPPQPIPSNTQTKTASIARTETMTGTKTVRAQAPQDYIYTEVHVGEVPFKHEEMGTYHQKDFHGTELDLSQIKKLEKEAKLRPNRPLSTPSVSESADSADRRRDPRHHFKIEVILVSKVRSFRTHSQNISLSGTMLEKEIPRDFLNTPFDLILVNPFEPNQTKARLLFKAKIVGDMTDPRRLMFIEKDESMTTRLSALLKAYVTYQQQVKKTAG